MLLKLWAADGTKPLAADEAAALLNKPAFKEAVASAIENYRPKPVGGSPGASGNLPSK